MTIEHCFCGATSHFDQITKYPIGTRLTLFEQKSPGAVIGCCDDGRAIIDVDGVIHTFHYLDSFVSSVDGINKKPESILFTCPDCRNITVDPADVQALEEDNVRLRDEVKRLEAQLSTKLTDIVDGNQELIDALKAVKAERT